MFAWRRYLFDFLGDVSGKRVLDVCCGYSMTPVMFALAGATVIANDVAPLTLEQVRRVAQMHGVEERITFYCGPAEQLPYPAKSFDIIYGGAAIHHLWIDAAGQELSRVLRTGGRGGFQDPLGHNPVLEFVRENLNYKNKHAEKGTDRPLSVADITSFGSHFTTYSWCGFDLLAMAPRVSHALHGFKSPLELLDNAVLSTIKPLQRYARFAVTLVSN
jgi:ubiquinone/menaquinone biosynthesis C-methylase UbiE